jgi:hypothetical protein
MLALGGWSLGKGAEAGYGDGYAPADLKQSPDLLDYSSEEPVMEELCV